MKKMNKFVIMLIAVMVTLVVVACKPEAVQTEQFEMEVQVRVEETRNAVATQSAIETYAAQLTALSMPTETPIPTEIPTLEPTPTESAPTAVVFPVGTATATNTPEPTAVSGDEPGTQCLQMQLITDGALSPGSVLAPGTTFSKTWTIKNIGTCTWTDNYDLILIAGEAFGTNGRADIDHEVAPGETIEVSLTNLVAPDTAGTYSSFWMLSHPNGARFGHGPNRSVSLSFKIEVKE